MLDSKVFNDLQLSGDSQEERTAKLRTLAQWKGTLASGRTAFLSASTSDRRTYMHGSTIEFAARRLLRLPIPGLLRGSLCRCKEQIDEFGDHADTCILLHGERCNRHHMVNRVGVHSSALQACLPAQIEAPHLNDDNNGRPADTLIPYGLEPIFGKREACYDVTGVGSSVEQYLERACNEVGGAMTFGISRKLRSTRALDSGKAVIPLPFESQGGLHENWRITFKQWAIHWASCGEGRDCQEQGQIARIWLVKAATVVQIAQHNLTRRLTNLLRCTDPHTGAAMRSNQPIHLVDLHNQRVQAPF